MLSTETQDEAARHNSGPGTNAAIVWGDGTSYDLEDPNPEIISLEDYAFALAYTVRFRGQTRDWAKGRRAFYGVGQHLVVGANEMQAEGVADEHIAAWLFHESGECPFGDLGGPAKKLFPGWRTREKQHCEAINARFGIETPDPDLIKRWDIRMYLTERRDLIPGGLVGKDITPGYEPFDREIVPYFHPDAAATHFLRHCERLGIAD